MAKRKRASYRGGDWRNLDEPEKYQAYLCSREWGLLKEAVRKRSGGKCERCKVLPMQATHHLTYERKYAEQLEDLAATCNACHDFTHGKSDFDPCDWNWLLGFLIYSRDQGWPFPPLEITAGLMSTESLNPQLAEIIKGARILEAADLEFAAITLVNRLPFAYPAPHAIDRLAFDPNAVLKCYVLCGYDPEKPEPAEWFSAEYHNPEG